MPTTQPTPVIIDQPAKSAKRRIDERNAQSAATRKENEQAALEYLLSNPQATASDLATHMGVHRTTAWKYITSLTGQEKLSKDDDTGWHVPQSFDELIEQHEEKADEDPDAEFEAWSRRAENLVEEKDGEEEETKEQLV